MCVFFRLNLERAWIITVSHNLTKPTQHWNEHTPSEKVIGVPTSLFQQGFIQRPPCVGDCSRHWDQGIEQGGQGHCPNGGYGPGGKTDIQQVNNTA